MAVPLDYAPPSPSRRGRVVLGWALCCVCMLLSLHVAATSIRIAWVLRHPPYNPEWALIERDLSYFLPPLIAAVAGACWWVCRRLRIGWRASGAAVVLALVAWLCAIVSFP